MEHCKATVREFLGTACVVYFGCGTACAWSIASEVSRFVVASSFGAVVATLGELFPGQYNSAVTLYLALENALPPSQALLSVMAQVGGALTGALLLLPGEDKTGTLGSNVLQADVPAAIFAEVLCTCALCLVAVRGRGWAAGSTVFACHLILLRQTGCSLNPARTLGPAIASTLRLGRNWREAPALRQLWLCLPPLAGSLLASLAQRALRRTEGALTRTAARREGRTCSIVLPESRA